MTKDKKAKNALFDAVHAAYQHINVPASKTGGAHQKGSQNLYANKDVISRLGESGSDNRETLGSQSGGAGSGVSRRAMSKTKTPNSAIQHSRDEQAARENGREDSSKRRK